MKYVAEKYSELCKTPSDINEHLPILYNHAKKCESVFETGVRGVISSWALIYGLLSNKDISVPRIFMNDISECDLTEILEKTKKLDIKISYKWCNNLTLDFDKEKFDLTFIDTWHVYGQLKRELTKFNKITNKYIIMHDTTIDGYLGESLRMGWDIFEQSSITGMPVEEIKKGLWPAIEEFLFKNKEWSLKKRYSNNNGLTILEKNN